MEFPVQVTTPQDSPHALKEWRSFLQNKGYKTSIKEKHSKYALFRNLNSIEQIEIKLGKYKVMNHFLQIADSDKAYLKEEVEATCPMCKKKHTAWNGDKYRLCRNCRQLKSVKDR